MNLRYLDFEQSLAELQDKISELRRVGDDNDFNITEEIMRLEKKRKELTESIFSNLTDWQVAQIARHPQRPYLLDYIPHIFTEFDEMHGDRRFADDNAIVAGTARIDDRPVVVIGNQKGRDTKEKVKRNFGMAQPEGYRKAQRMMELAERFKLPVLTFIDTAGAYPGIGGEERGQSEAIARNLAVMTKLRVPIINVVLGEGCSGGALAIGVGDCFMMLQYSTFSVITPEGCASILWKSAEKAPIAAEAMSLTATRLLSLGVIDKIIPEPLGSAYRDLALMSERIKTTLVQELIELNRLSVQDLLERRYQRLMSYGINQ